MLACGMILIGLIMNRYQFYHLHMQADFCAIIYYMSYQLRMHQL